MCTKIFPGYSINPKISLLILRIYIFYFVLHISFSTIFVCHAILYFTATMAEANDICELTKEGVQSILEGYSVNDSDRSLRQVPNETLGLSSVRQNLSSLFNQLRRGITNRIGRNTNQPKKSNTNGS